MKFGSFGASLLVHALVLGVLVVPAGTAARRILPMPQATPNVTMALVELAKLQAKAPTPTAQGTIRYPKKKKHEPPKPKLAEKPKDAVKVAAKPKPKPTPAPKQDDKDKKIFDALRKYKQFAGMTDEQIRKMPMPPGMTSWQQVLKMTQDLDKLDWTQPPPETGDRQTASASAGGFFGWAPASLNQDSAYMGGVQREQANGKWHFAFQYFGTVMVAEWAEGATSAKVAYYPINGKPDEAKTFEVLVQPKDEDMSGAMIAQYTLISMGQPPQPVPSSVSSSAH